ncbi:unnamed protein product [Phytomonas sp. EM1]|nr:unnamed protein product [Phytomonas sp. EM1]|eukprot:CCW64426.1 unnamed protein product [Phytomonas sp. isolate EM1]
MVAKKGRKKDKKKGQVKRTAEQIAAEAEALRRAEVQKLEDEALAFINEENGRREQDEQKEESARIQAKLQQQLKEKDYSIEQLEAKLLEANSIINTDRESSISQIQELSIHCQSLLNEVSHLRSVDKERRLQYTKEIQERVHEIHKLNDEISELKLQASNEKKIFNEKLSTLQSLVEVKQTVVTEMGSETTEKSGVREECFMASLAKMEKVMLHNSELRDEVRRSKIEKGEATAIVQILHAQIDSNKYQLHNAIIEAKNDLLHTKDEITRLQAEKTDLREALEDRDRQLTDLKHRLEAERNEFEQQLDQISFDSQYLTSEIQAMREDSAKALSDLEQTKTRAEEESKRLAVELESVNHKNNNLEALLRAMQIENQEKLSLLSAQLSNSRITISRLQKAIAEERESRARELKSQSREVERALEELKRLHEVDSRKIKDNKVVEQGGLEGEVPFLTKALSNAQLDLWEAKRQVLELQLDASEELRRLRAILDAHYIPHQAGVSECAGSGRDDAQQIWSSEKNIERIRRELAQIEANDWQKTLISDQAETIARLKIELNKAEFDHAQSMREMEEEIRCLKKALEAITDDSAREVCI